MKLGFAIRIARTRAGLAQADLAAMCGHTPSMLSMVESGQRQPRASTIEAIAKALGVSPLVLYLLAAEPSNLPNGRAGLEVLGRIATVVDDLWRARAAVAQAVRPTNGRKEEHGS
jgi:transcriptional regulator with XRE-family HTH domain